MQNIMKRFVKDESGATAIEYGLIAALIAVGIIAVRADCWARRSPRHLRAVSAPPWQAACSLSILLSSTARDAPSVLPSAAGGVALVKALIVGMPGPSLGVLVTFVS